MFPMALGFSELYLELNCVMQLPCVCVSVCRFSMQMSPISQSMDLMPVLYIIEFLSENIWQIHYTERVPTRHLSAYLFSAGWGWDFLLSICDFFPCLFHALTALVLIFDSCSRHRIL